jgi:hypothetical protein
VKKIAAAAAEIAKLDGRMPEAIKPSRKRPDPTSVKPHAHVHTGPKDFRMALAEVLDTAKLMHARDVNSNPISRVEMP